MLLSLLMLSSLAAPDDNPARDTLRVAGSNDIYRLQIRDMADAASVAPVRDPGELFGKPGYYLYDMDAWSMVSSGPIIGPLRGRSYSLFGAGFDDPTLNRWTMRSESLRRSSDADAYPDGYWRYSRWRF